jgi:hypothetical protein
MRALLPDAPNPNGWPYRLMVAWESRAWKPWEEGTATHAMSIMPPGRTHFRLEDMGPARFKVWLPFLEGKSLPQVIDDELAYVEHVIDRLPADAALVVFSNGVGTSALAVVTGLLARQVGWQAAEEIVQAFRTTLPVPWVKPAGVLIDAWRQRLARQDHSPC